MAQGVFRWPLASIRCGGNIDGVLRMVGVRSAPTDSGGVPLLWMGSSWRCSQLRGHRGLRESELRSSDSVALSHCTRGASRSGLSYFLGSAEAEGQTHG